MSYKATKPGLVSVLYLSMRYTVLLFVRAPFLCIVSFRSINQNQITFVKRQKSRANWRRVISALEIFQRIRDFLLMCYINLRLLTYLLTYLRDMCGLLVVLVKLSVLAKWLARKTPLKKPNRGEGIVSRKPRPKSVYDFLGLLYRYCFIMYLCCLLPLLDIFSYFYGRYSLFVLKVPNPKQTNNIGYNAQKLLKELRSTYWNEQSLRRLTE